MINDKIRVFQFGLDGTTKLAVYSVEKLPDGKYRTEPSTSFAIPKAVGGVKIGTTGKVVSTPIQVARNMVHGFKEGASFGGGVQIVEVEFDEPYAKMRAFIPVDHIRVI